MSKKLKIIVRELSANSRDAKDLLPEYVERYMQLGQEHAMLHLMMEYYMFYETVEEEANPYFDTVRDTAQSFHEEMEKFFKNKTDEKARREIAGRLLAIREDIISRMKALTAYIDRFSVYEYVLQRVRYRFEEPGKVPSDAEFTKKLMEFIFGSRDNMEVSERLRCVMGQLPIRITRSRYFDLIRDCISLYIGSDKGALDEFLYLFRTNATFFKQEMMETCFGEFAPVVEELSNLDYEKMDRETYQKYMDQIADNARKLDSLVDLYMQMIQLTNGLYIACVTAGYVADSSRVDETELMLRGVNSLFLDRESDVWSLNEGKPLETKEEKLAWLTPLFEKVEGRQESIAEEIVMAGAVLEETMEVQKENIKESGLQAEFIELKRISRLTSSSLFAELEEEVLNENVTEEMADEIAAQLIEECRAFFKGRSRMLRRAVMANTMQSMPFFFKTSEEIAEYITNSLSQCEDEAEKSAAKRLLLDDMI